MSQIHVLDAETIDKIAAGEVVERPASVVKELVENAIDAGATSITVEIKDGGISFMRITDNGSGIAKEQIRTAFLRHATSKIESAEDLSRIASLGFRGEALSSISAVSQVELVTKTADSLTGTRVIIEGGVEKVFEEVGAPDGTTFLVRNLFFNTPVRRKFLKQPATEGGYVADLMEHLALSRPDISFKFMMGSQTKFYTSGNGELKEVIYRIYGKDVASNLIPMNFSENGFQIKGYLGSPALVRSNRNHEIYFLNGRFIRSSVLSKAIEEGYKEYLMQHKFPLCVLHMNVEDKSQVDVNVHPTKMEVRFSDGPAVYNLIMQAVRNALKRKEMIPETTLPEAKVPARAEAISMETKAPAKVTYAEVAMPGMPTRPASRPVTETVNRTERTSGGKSEKDMPEQWNNQGSTIGLQELKIMSDMLENTKVDAPTEHTGTIAKATQATSKEFEINFEEETVQIPAATAKKVSIPEPFETKRTQSFKVMEEMRYESERAKMTDFKQETLFETKVISQENRTQYSIIGQVFDTYWLVQFEDKLFIIDQHAAHEKVKYERFMKQYHEKTIVTQNLMPPIIVSLTGKEEMILKEYEEQFVNLGFEIEEFGGDEYALRAVPVDLYGCDEKQMFLEVLDELSDMGPRESLKVVEEKIASMSCKAAVKGNNRISREEAEKLIDELLTLENPYNCPHGRPTIITMSKYEMEKRFKR